MNKHQLDRACYKSSKPTMMKIIKAQRNALDLDLKMMHAYAHLILPEHAEAYRGHLLAVQSHDGHNIQDLLDQHGSVRL